MKIQKTRNKGITLIALVITIIVMLILVGVTVTVALNGGLFSTAKRAAKKMQEAIDDEQLLADLISDADRIRKKYPLEGYYRQSSEDEFILTSENVFDAYDEILSKYNTCYGNENIEGKEKLTLTTAIKAANSFYQVYDQEVQKFGVDSRSACNFWDYLVGYGDYPKYITLSDEINTQENKIKLNTLLFSFSCCKYNPQLIDEKGNLNIIYAKNGNTKYSIICLKYDAGSDGSLSWSAHDFNSDKEIFNLLYPGGNFPIDDITGNTSSYFNTIKDRTDGEIIKITEENKDSFEFMQGMIEGKDTSEYIGSIVCLYTIDDSYKSGLLCHNDFIINSDNGEIIYVDDNGKPNKDFL